jgi:hypothetical protein
LTQTGGTSGYNDAGRSGAIDPGRSLITVSRLSSLPVVMLKAPDDIQEGHQPNAMGQIRNDVNKQKMAAVGEGWPLGHALVVVAGSAPELSASLRVHERVICEECEIASKTPVNPEEIVVVELADDSIVDIALSDQPDANSGSAG